MRPTRGRPRRSGRSPCQTTPTCRRPTLRSRSRRHRIATTQPSSWPGCGRRRRRTCSRALASSRHPDRGAAVGLDGLLRPLVVVACVIALAFLGLPVVVLILRSAEAGALQAAITSPEVRDALVISLVSSTLATLIVIVFGTPLAWVLARRTFPGRWLATAAVDLPIVLPPAVAGFALLLTFGRRGVAGP